MPRQRRDSLRFLADARKCLWVREKGFLEQTGDRKHLTERGAKEETPSLRNKHISEWDKLVSHNTKRVIGKGGGRLDIDCRNPNAQLRRSLAEQPVEVEVGCS